MIPVLQFAAFDGVFALGFALLVVALGIVMILGIVYMEHRKEMKLIEAGAYEAVKEDSRAWILAVGLLLLAVGVGNMLEDAIAGVPVVDGITAALIGIAALVYYGIKRRQSAATAEAENTERSA
jgi:Asp/Glu/hydantoin racemase